MAYGEYKNSGRCPGKCLYQLSAMGVPIRIVETVIFEGMNQITSYGKPFAFYSWLSDDTPIFQFYEEFQSYDRLQEEWMNREATPACRNQYQELTGK